MPTKLPPGWMAVLQEERSKPYFQDLIHFLDDEYRAGKVVYPPRESIFRALEEVDLPDVRVVILGQDPYHGEGQAIGLSFAVPNSLKRKPPSLANIIKELQSDLKCAIPAGASDLSGWAEQGVLLLNTILTVETAKPLSHRNRGWERFTDRIIEILNAREKPMLFILWGAHAQKKKGMIDLSRHRVLESVHPSPLSAHRGFFGSRVFSHANRILREELRLSPIHWERVSSDPSDGLSTRRVVTGDGDRAHSGR